MFDIIYFIKFAISSLPSTSTSSLSLSTCNVRKTVAQTVETKESCRKVEIIDNYKQESVSDIVELQVQAEAGFMLYKL